MLTIESVTEILIRSRGHRKEAADELFSRLYGELEGLARRQLRSSQGATLNTAGLINETYLRVVDQAQANWEDRSHFFSYAATAMRHVLVDRARRRGAQKRGSGLRPVTFTERAFSPDESGEILIELHEALECLAESEPRLAKVVDLRFFGGLTEEEAATVMGVSARTIRRDWFKAKARLHEEISRDGHACGEPSGSEASADD